jgi:hypothetical protein
MIEDVTGEASYKDINSPDYDRQVAEDALYHTIGPLTDAPRWAAEWSSPGSPVPGFVPNGAAPRWTRDEIIIAYAGDPSMLAGTTKDNPRSPKYGRTGGAPLYRQVMKQLRRFNRAGDFQAMADAYNNGLFGLLSFMRKGKDESRSAFIPFVWRGVEGAITSGVGSNVEAIRASAAASKSGTRGLKSLFEVDSADEAREIANQVKGEYQTTQSDDLSPENPFGIYSSRFYKVAMDYANALEAKDEDMISAAEQNIESLLDTIKSDGVAVRGIGTGSEQAISTPDRSTSVSIKSIDAGKRGEDEARTATLDIPERPEDKSGIEPEAIEAALNICLTHDLGKEIGMTQTFQKIAIDAGAEIDARGVPVIGGPMTANELRYIIRNMGPLGKFYPGRKVVRKNLQIVRDAPGWWSPGEDPEIEPIPGTDQIWESIWLRSGCPHMGDTEISVEMTNEVRDLNANKIATKRTIKMKRDPRTGEMTKEESISKVAVNAALRKAYVKLKIAADLWKRESGEEDDIDESRHKDGLLTIKESYDSIDRKMISEAFSYILRRVRHGILGNYFIS